MYAIINPLYPNRVQLQLSTQPGNNLVGPLATPAGVMFDPRSNLELYLDGVAVDIRSFAFDTSNDQYLLFTDVIIDVDGVVQIIYHLPAAPFVGAKGTIPGFALIATIIEAYDPVLPILGVLVPIAKNATFAFYQGGGNPNLTFNVPAITGWNIGGFGEGQFGGGGLDPILVSYYALGIAQVRLTSTTTSLDSGLIAATALYGSTVLTNLSPGDSVGMLLEAYDAKGNPMSIQGVLMQIAFTIVIDAAP